MLAKLFLKPLPITPWKTATFSRHYRTIVRAGLYERLAQGPVPASSIAFTRLMVQVQDWLRSPG